MNMTMKETLAPVFSKFSFSGTLTSDNARLRSQGGGVLLTLMVAGFIAAIAYADSRVAEISLGFLYILPIALSGLVNRLSTSLFFVVVCVIMHDLYGPEQTLPFRLLLNLFALIGLTVIALLVNRLGRERQALSEIISRQLDELTKELELAAEVQQRLLPSMPPQIPGVEIASGITYNGEMGGDYFDFIELPDGEYGIAIADVSGKRTSAAILMSSIEVALRLNALNDQDTVKGLEDLNKVICEVTENARYATLFYAKLDIAKKKIEYTNAGHNPPLIYRKKSGTIEWLEGVGTPVGMFPEMKYSAKTLQLEKGDVLVCYTDGLTEAENSGGIQFSADEIARIAKKNSGKNAQEIFDCLMTSVIEFHGSDKFDDDLTLIVLKIS
jgi:serine phosphatase RsbU (regulator of sigma subunit)